jgi:hypothetical protein
VILVLILATVGFLGFGLIRESNRPDFLSRPSGTLMDGFTKPYRNPNHPLFGHRGPLALRIVGICLAAIGTIGLLTVVLRNLE